MTVRLAPAEEASGYLAGVISRRLQDGDEVFWLVPGGSAIRAAVDAADLMSDSDLQLLSICLTDERYGPPGHSDSNLAQLERAGFNPKAAAVRPVLRGWDIERTTAAYGQLLERQLTSKAYKIGLFGIGADGHTAGIMPNSPAGDEADLATAFAGTDFMRITMSPRAISLLDEAVVYATGEQKHPVIRKLLESSGCDEDSQPAQVLRLVPRLTVFSDYKNYGL